MVGVVCVVVVVVVFVVVVIVVVSSHGQFTALQMMINSATRKESPNLFQ